MSAKKSLKIAFDFAAILIFAFFLFNSIYKINNVFAASSPNYYAKAISSNVKLYRTTNGSEEFTNIYFSIPQSYFVEISSCENELYFTAKYIDVVGYVKKSEVQCVSGIPQTPYASASFRIFIPGGVDLRSSPSQSMGLNTVSELDFLETNLKFYGYIDGEEAISHKSTIWYYCKYIKNGKETFGYVYSAFCDLLTTIPSNTETLEYIDAPDFSTSTSGQAGGTEQDKMGALPSATQIIIIIAVCLPCIAIIYLLFRPTKITAKALEDAEIKPGKKRKKRRVKGQDFYEYDE